MTGLQFDHLVLIVRDQLDRIAPYFERDGYCLTDVSVHNLGSMNRLITLDTGYIELLGWPAGKPPARKEIADSPVGMDALVFRSYDAHETYEHLKRSGFDVNPVQRLERPVQVNGQTHMARFDTVRFATQPIAGFRVYFCHHLTPEYLWAPEFMHHANGAKDVSRIVIESPETAVTAQTLAALVKQEPLASADNTYQIHLPNIVLTISPQLLGTVATLADVQLRHQDGRHSLFNSHLNPRV